jgi:hypothetical protein
MTTTLGRRVGLLEGAVQRELRRQLGAAVVRLRETMAPEHARLVVSWMREHGLGERRGGDPGHPSHPCTGRPNHACAGCIDRLDPPALVRAAWVLLFEHLGHGAPVALPPEVARVYLEHPDAAPTAPCAGCGYRLPARGGRLAYAGACPVCGARTTRSGTPWAGARA